MITGLLLALGAWSGLVCLYTLPTPKILSFGLAVAVFALHAYACRRRPWVVAAVIVSAFVLVYFFVFTRPNPSREWAADHARMPRAQFHGRRVVVDDVRNFHWRSATEFTERFERREYDLDRLHSMYYLVVPLRGLELVAHVFVCFGFTDGQHVAISVEGRRPAGTPYRVIASMFRQYELIYVIGDERDVVGKRGVAWGHPVRFYPARASPERIQAIFVDMLERANTLAENPEFYHLLFNNCMNNLTHHLRRLGGRSVPADLRLLLTGLSDRVAHAYGFLDTNLPFEKAREAYRVDEWMRSTVLDDSFSLRLRETLRRQGADIVPP